MSVLPHIRDAGDRANAVPQKAYREFGAIFGEKLSHLHFSWTLMHSFKQNQTTKLGVNGLRVAAFAHLSLRL